MNASFFRLGPQRSHWPRHHAAEPCHPVTQLPCERGRTIRPRRWLDCARAIHRRLCRLELRLLLQRHTTSPRRSRLSRCRLRHAPDPPLLRRVDLETLARATPTLCTGGDLQPRARPAPVDEEFRRRRWSAASVARAAVCAGLHCRAWARPRPTAHRRSSTRASRLALREGLALLLRLLLERSALQLRRSLPQLAQLWHNTRSVQSCERSKMKTAPATHPLRLLAEAPCQLRALLLAEEVVRVLGPSAAPSLCANSWGRIPAFRRSKSASQQVSKSGSVVQYQQRFRCDTHAASCSSTGRISSSLAAAASSCGA